VFTKRIHVFKAGDQTSAQGVQRNFSDKDLEQVVKTYDPAIHEAPLVIGHAGDNDSTPAYGWIKGFAKQGGNLYADVAFTDTAKDLVKDGHYRKVSISFYSPDSAINPHKGKWSARHLALLGASPPAVKGLEPFSFSEAEGVYDFAVALAPSDLFDDDLGPTLIVEKSPLEMLREKLDEVRQDVSGAVAELQGNTQNQQVNQVDEAAGSAADNPDVNRMANPDNPSQQYSEVKKTKGREGTEITQQTADLEDQFPEEEFMDQGQISRKHAKGANGQVMQVVENVYEEGHTDSDMMRKHGGDGGPGTNHKESTDERKAAADRASEAKRLKNEGKSGEAKMAKRFGKEEDKLISEDHKELTPGQRKIDKNKNGKIDGEDMKMLHDDHAEGDEFGRYETARSADNGYVDRMKTGKAGAGAQTGRFKTAQSGEQDADRMDTAENGEQDADRMKTAKESEMDPEGSERWAGQADNYERVNNMDQYDVDADSYGVNAPKTSKGTDPYGRQESETKMPVESEEMPDDEIFAVKTVNVMSDGSMRVIRQKSSDARPKSVKTHDLLYAEGGPQADEMTGEDGVTTARKSMKGSKMVEHAEYETGDISGEASLESLREEIGDGKKSKSKQLTPGAMCDTDTPGQIVGPDGAFAESYRGEPKSKAKQLTPGAMDDTDDENQVTGPDGVFAESLEGLRENIGDGKKSNKRQLTPGAMNDTDTEDQVTMRAGGVTGGADHGEKKCKDPYTKTGFGSTYDEGEGDDGVDEGEEDYNELSADHACGMDYGMGSMSQARAQGFPQQMYDELMSLKSKYAELERRHAEEKMSARREKMAGAIGHLYTEGRLTDGIMPEQELISYCEGLEFGTLEFSEGETPATKLLGLLSKLPPMVSFGEVAGGTFQYAEDDLDPHAKALQMVEKGEAVDYVEALKKTMFS
jgi:hypothetical protein